MNPPEIGSGRPSPPTAPALLAAIDDDPDAQWLNNLPMVGALRAIWDQECVQNPHGARVLRHGRFREGADFLDSPYDLDPRWSRKRDTSWRGYKAHLSETCDQDTPNLIIDVQTTPATRVMAFSGCC